MSKEQVLKFYIAYGMSGQYNDRYSNSGCFPPKLSPAATTGIMGACCVWAYDEKEKAEEACLHLAKTHPRHQFRLEECWGDLNWQERERQRFATGHYLRTPWEEQSAMWFCHPDYHHVHVSSTDTKMVAFTEDDKKGQMDLQTKMAPGRYLKKFFGDYLSASDIGRLSAEFEAWYAKPELQFADTEAEIERVYLEGPSSCMSKCARDINEGGSACYDAEIGEYYHPVRAYAAGDLAVAYIVRGERITARTLCWPAKKIYSRIYGDAVRLKTALSAAGFQTSYGQSSNLHNLYGARLLRRAFSHGGVAVPYIDDGYLVEYGDGKHLVITDGDPCRARTITGHHGKNVIHDDSLPSGDQK
jgi:hypothetical protein